LNFSIVQCADLITDMRMRFSVQLG
jgi:hypothetical protein